MLPLLAKLLAQVATAGVARSVAQSAARAAAASGPPGRGNLVTATFLIVVQIVFHIGR